MNRSTYILPKRNFEIRCFAPLFLFGFSFLFTLEISPANIPIFLIFFIISQFLGFSLLFIIKKSKGAFWNFLIDAGYMLCLAFPFAYATIFHYTKFKAEGSFIWFFGLVNILAWLLSFYLGKKQFSNLSRQDSKSGPLDIKKSLWDLQKAYHSSGESFEKDKGEKWMRIGRIAIYFGPVIGSAIYRALNQAQFLSFMGIFFFSAVVFLVSLSGRSASFAIGIKELEKALKKTINIKELE